MLIKLPERIRTNKKYQNLNEVEKITNRFDGISLAEMDSHALLNRVDTKFVLSEADLLSALKDLEDDYAILDIEGVRLNHYRTLYFDTPGFALYNEHINRGRNCYKVRSREYIDSAISFLEVKFKNQKKRTIKSRIPTEALVQGFDLDERSFLAKNYPDSAKALEPKLWNTFTRITLVNKHEIERVTIDLNLRFFNKDAERELSGVVIAEVKQDGFLQNPAFIRKMRSLGVRSSGFSKYCVGVSLLYDNVKKNNLKPKLLMVQKLQKGAMYG